MPEFGLPNWYTGLPKSLDTSLNNIDSGSSPDETPEDHLKKLDIKTVAVGGWLKVYYDKEFFNGKVLTKAFSSVQFKCLKHPFDMHVS